MLGRHTAASSAGINSVCGGAQSAIAHTVPFVRIVMKFAGLLALGSILASVGVLAIPIADFDAKVAAGLRLIQTSDEKPPFWATEQDKLELLKQKVNFVSARIRLAEKSYLIYGLPSLT